MKLMRDSRWFEEGRKAAADGKSYADNPYAEGSPKWYIWNEGFAS